MSEDGKQLYNACFQQSSEKALKLLSSWDAPRIQATNTYKGGIGTSFYAACFNGHVQVAEMLLRHGADANAKHLEGKTPLDLVHLSDHDTKLEDVFVAHEIRLAQLPAWLPPLPGDTPTMQTTAHVVGVVHVWLKPLLPGPTTTHPFPYLDALISGTIKRDPKLATAVDDIRKIINEAPAEASVMDCATLQVIITQAVDSLDQALRAPEALKNRLRHLDPKTDAVESVLQDLHDLANQFELQPVLHELQTVLATFPDPPTAPASAPKTPPADIATALNKLAMPRNIGPERQKLLDSTESNLKRLTLALIDSLGAVAKAGAAEMIQCVVTLWRCTQCSDVSEPPPAKALPEAWKQLCRAHEMLSVPEHNGLEQLAIWVGTHDYFHLNWYLAFVHHELLALMQRLQDMADWQTTTLSVLALCKTCINEITRDSASRIVSAHEEMSKLQQQIQATKAFLTFAPDELRAGLEAGVQDKQERLTTLRHQLAAQPHVDRVAELAKLLHQHFPALLVLLHPEQSSLGAHLRAVLGPDLPASLIFEVMTEVNQALTLSSLGQLDLYYNQNHKVYKAHAALPNCSAQDLAVKEYAFARQQKHDQCRTFLRELRAMRQLEHPNIIPVLGTLVDVHNGHPSAYLVQPWCTQGDLQQWLSRARHLATSAVITGLMNQLRAALAFMHSKGLVHRDVKLSNVMLDGEEDRPVVRLGDFDMAKAAAEATMLPCTTTASSGTAGYVAPEVLFGDGCVGARPAQDAFSFGCVLYNTYMFPQTVPAARLPTDQLVDKCKWNFQAGGTDCSFPHLAAEMCDSASYLYREARALLATDPKGRPSLFSAGLIAQQPVAHKVGPAIDVLRDAPELVQEVADLLEQLSCDGRGPDTIAVRRVKRVENPVLWERYSAKRREMLHRITSQRHCDQLQTAKVDALPGLPALLRNTSCQERLLLHGIAADKSLRDKIVRLGLDYRFAGSSRGHRFGHGTYLSDHPGKTHQYAKAGPNGERMLIVTRALLGQAYVDEAPNSKALAPPLLPSAPNNERYDSVIATPHGRFQEVIMFENAQMYPELVVYYTAD
ncbi:uncharacterized protein MONBRDRAFT_28632 [Monosiga brevicollis MX1]|uniref:Protein kinase domain-containing protein n=1 Tax=Monosiga brevicollis TaxID=81824 RepID=A9V8R0_MONBE|nr:uncharacterized protein MONBRDRAFT_28632 [Monosiga brevicollis MX1]EDQ86127.1 predicted protein [Monosiga brevicollis MX1]|eukprot:XP_001749052.1 hypothetical protein [Monosiga brevicollis MX1]